MEFMQWKVCVEIEKRVGVDDGRNKSKQRNVIRLAIDCRLNDVVCERPPSASLCRGVILKGAFGNRSLARYLVEILDDVEAGETDPTQDDQSPHNLSPHTTEYPRNR